MSEIDTVLNKSSKQLHSLVKTLKDNNTALRYNLTEGLLVKRNVETIKKRKVQHKFRKHPDPLTSESDVLSVGHAKHRFSDSSVSINYNTSTARSNNSVLSARFVHRSKSSEVVYFPHLRMEATEKNILDDRSVIKVQQNYAQITAKLKIHDKAKIIYSKSASQNKTVDTADVKSLVYKKNIDKKLRDYVQKISICMDDIRTVMITGLEPPDGDEDWEKARIRTVEFASRFTRNYLYHLGREISDLQDMSKKSKNPGNISNRTAKNVHQCLLTAHQTILQALQAYRSHMTTLLANALADKLLFITEQTYKLCEIHARYVNLKQTGSSKRESLIEGLTNKCNSLLEMIRDVIEKRNKIDEVDSPATKLSLMGYNINYKKPIAKISKPRKKNVLEARLSMYSVASGIRRKDVFWKKTVEMLAKDKLRYNHVQSRYKTSGFKHRPLPEKPIVVDLPSKSKVFNRRSSCLLNNTPIGTPGNEDEIVTLVEIQKNRDHNNIENTSSVTYCEQETTAMKDKQFQVLTPLIQGLCQEVCSRNQEAVSQKQLEILLKDLLGMALDGKINNNDDGKEIGSKKNGFVRQNGTLRRLLGTNQHSVVGSNPNEYPKILSEINQHDKELSKKQVEVLHVEGSDIVPSEEKETNKSEKDKGSTEIIKNNKIENNKIDLNRKLEEQVSLIVAKKNKRRQTVTVTGAKNAQLICIRDEDSVIESTDQTKSPHFKDKNELMKNKNEPAKQRCDKETTIHEIPNEIQKTVRKTSKTKSKSEPQSCKSSKPNIKINRLPKKILKQLALIPKTQAFNAIQYKLLYSKFSRRNHMYRKSSTVQPWTIVDTISENLLDDILLSIAKEIEVEEILESLYQSEFQ